MHYEKIVLADYFVDVPVWTASIESRVHMAARNSIKNAPIALVRTSHNPKVTVFMDVEYMPVPEIAPGMVLEFLTNRSQYLKSPLWYTFW